MKKNALFTVPLIILIGIFTGFYLYNDRVTTNYRHSKATRMRMAVVGALGGPAIPIIGQCCTSRNLFEGVYARRSDIPGGFCFHSDCDVTAVPKAVGEKNYTIKVIAD